MSRVISNLTFGLGIAASMGMLSHKAHAAPITCTSTINLGASGNGFVLDSALTAGVCVQTANATFGNFVISSLPANGRVAFNVTNFGTPLEAYLGISFNDNFEAGNTYTANYSVEISSGSQLFNSLNTDFTQNDGTSNVKTHATPAGVGGIDWTKVGSIGTGPDEIDWSNGQVRLNINNTLVDNGSISALTNDIIENGPVGVNEPATLALLGTGALCMLAVSRRRPRGGNMAHAA